MNPATRRILIAYRWPLTFLVLGGMLVVVILGGYFLASSAYKHSVDGGVKASHDMLDRIEGLFSGASQSNLKASFLADIPSITDAGGGHLELAKVERTETLRSEDRLSVLWDKISLGTSIAEIRVPATYRYYVKLDDPWEIQVHGSVCRVYAPPLRTMMPPAIHTHRMEKRVESGWARFNTESQMDALEKQLTPTLVQYAENDSLMVLVRDQARKSLARFVRHWLLQSSMKDDSDIEWIDVRFKGEVEENGEHTPPMMTLHE